MKPKTMKIAKGFSLGLDAATKTFAILAQRRKGKTYTASVMAEEMVKVGIPWVAIDPTGAWWGMRAGADGKSRGGLDVYVFGGQHGDLPLERTAGKVIADLVVDNPGHYVLDLSSFESKEAERRFVTDFAERLYRRKAKQSSPLHLFIDEADVFVPQKVPSGDHRMLGAFEALVRRGGIRGIGVTLISQRAAVVNKNVLEQIDVLVVLRIVGPNDQKAIMTYVEAHGSEEEKKELRASMASLKLGEAWFWEPGAEPAIFVRVQVRERRTFNSSATPKAGEGKHVIPKMTKIDLDALRGDIESTIEKAAEEDPEELQARLDEANRTIKRMEREQEKVEPEQVEVEVEVKVPVPVIDEETKQLFERFNVLGEELGRRIEAAMKEAVEGIEIKGGKNGGRIKGFGAPKKTGRLAGESKPKPRPVPAAAPRRQPEYASGEEIKLGKAERSVLTVLIQFGPKPKKALATLAGYASGGGSFNNALGKLRTNEMITGSSEIEITELGEDAMVGQVEALPTGEALFHYWLGKLGKAEREVLTVLYEAGPEARMNKQEIADLTESQYASNGGSFNNALGALRTRDLILGKGDEIRVSETLFS